MRNLTGVAAVFFSALCMRSSIADDAPAQPLAEAEVAHQFETAAPALFHEWLADRPGELKSLADGRNVESQGYTLYYCFEFTVCEDVAPPTAYKIDVRKTDSILTPFVGTLIIPVKLSCADRILTSSRSRSESDKMAPVCIDHSYADCASAGAKPPSGFSKFNKAMGSGGPCTSRDGLKFGYEDEIRVSYGWRQGKWEFQEEMKKKPRDAQSTRS